MFKTITFTIIELILSDLNEQSKAYCIQRAESKIQLPSGPDLADGDAACPCSDFKQKHTIEKTAFH